MTRCSCIEGRLFRGKKYEPTNLQVHDCDYVRNRNVLIEEAESMANNHCDKKDKLQWSHEFFRFMDILAKEKGIAA